MSQINIGILEDDEDQSALLQLWLSDAGYDVVACTDGSEFIRTAQSRGFDLMILDWMVPGMDGLQVLEWVRLNIQERVPVVFLTARGEEKQIVKALNAGADDYVTKPARHAELLARVESLARRSGLADEQPDTLEIGEFVLNHKLGEVTVNGTPVALTGRELTLAWFLFNNLSKILSRDYLLRNIWNINPSVNTRTVDTHISRIRSKLDLRPENGWKLSSVYHHGYRLEQIDQ